ncbi:MAG: response regulator transcription factor [Bryobacterales bacterium]|nr:response regulator transcription factor [Acidobacteriota bacterium]MCB9384124.1 response regulator transcription factor [Bryobacterales bacterium]
MRTIAVIEDDADLHELLLHTLRQNGYQAVGSKTGADALGFLRAVKPDLVLLDILLPGQDGIEICRQVRADAGLKNVPVVFLTALGDETDRVLGLEIGGNDYVVKPFSLRELLARIKIHLRAESEPNEVLTAGPIELNRTQYIVRLRGEPVSLTATEFRLLEHLMRRPGQVFRRDALLDAAWAERTDVMERTVDAYVVRLRNKLEDNPSKPRYIRSVRGVGYTFRNDGE